MRYYSHIYPLSANLKVKNSIDGAQIDIFSSFIFINQFNLTRERMRRQRKEKAVSNNIRHKIQNKIYK